MERGETGEQRVGVGRERDGLGGELGKLLAQRLPLRLQVLDLQRTRRCTRNRLAQIRRRHVGCSEVGFGVGNPVVLEANGTWRRQQPHGGVEIAVHRLDLLQPAGGRQIALQQFVDRGAIAQRVVQPRLHAARARERAKHADNDEARQHAGDAEQRVRGDLHRDRDRQRLAGVGAQPQGAAILARRQLPIHRERDIA